MRKPRFISPCVANAYTGPNERIAEFSFNDGAGGLIALRRMKDGRNLVRLYRLEGCEPSIEGAPDYSGIIDAAFEVVDGGASPEAIDRLRTLLDQHFPDDRS